MLDQLLISLGTDGTTKNFQRKAERGEYHMHNSHNHFLNEDHDGLLIMLKLL